MLLSLVLREEEGVVGKRKGPGTVEGGAKGRSTKGGDLVRALLVRKAQSQKGQGL